MFVRISWLIFATFSMALCVPWYWSYLPWPSEPLWLGVTTDVWVTALSALAIVLATLVLLWYESFRNHRSIATVNRERELARDELRQLEQRLTTQTTAHQAELLSQREQVDALQLELESRLAKQAVQEESWQREKKHIEAGHERREITLRARTDRLVTEVKQFQIEQSDWEQRWRQQEHDLATRHEQFQTTLNRWETQRDEKDKELAERQQTLDDKQAKLTQLCESAEQERWQWSHTRRHEEDQLAERRKELDLKEKELQIRIEATDQRLTKRAEQVASMEDQLHRDQFAWEQKLADQQLELAKWKDSLRNHELELQRERERNDREIAQRLSRLDQQEAKLAANQEAFQQFQTNWDEQKHRWENEIACRAEQVSTLAREYEALVLQNQAPSPDASSDSDAADQPDHPFEEEEAVEDVEWASIDSEDDAQEQDGYAVPSRDFERDHDSNADWDDDDTPIVHRLALLGRKKRRDRRPK